MYEIILSPIRRSLYALVGMAKYELLKMVSAGAVLAGGLVTAAALGVEFVGFEPGEQAPQAFNWLEGAGCATFALGAAGLLAYKILSPSWPDNDDRDHWRSGY